MVHPVNAVMRFLLAGGFLKVLQLLNLALFFTFTAELVDALALLERLLLFGPYALLVAEQRWVP